MTSKRLVLFETKTYLSKGVSSEGNCPRLGGIVVNCPAGGIFVDTVTPMASPGVATEEVVIAETSGVPDGGKLFALI